MDVNATEAFPHQMVYLYELESLFVPCQDCRWKKLQKREDFVPVLDVATGELANNIWVTHHFSIIQQMLKIGIPLPKVANPY